MFKTQIAQKFLDERERQETKFTQKHDDGHTPDDFAELIKRVADEAVTVVDGGVSTKLFIEHMAEIGATAIAAIEHCSRAAAETERGEDAEWYTEIEEGRKIFEKMVEGR